MKTLFFSILMLFCFVSYGQKTLIIDKASTLSNGEVMSNQNSSDNNISQVKSGIPYDPNLCGVWIKETPVISNDGSPVKVPKTDYVNTNGYCKVKYNSTNGTIRMGDPITSSSIPGEAMKATQSGVILGIAMEDAQMPTGLIKVRIMIQYLKQ